MISQNVLPFKLKITEENLTANSGTLLLVEYIVALGLEKLVNLYIPGPKSNRGYKPSEYILPLILMLQNGGQHLEDINKLRFDEKMLKLMGIKNIPSSDAVGDWLRRIGNSEDGIETLNKLKQIALNRILREDKIQEYTLDIDATEIIGDKQESKWTYNKNKGYMPILGFLFESGVCLHEEFRMGNISPNARNLEIYKKCRKKMPEGKKIKFCRIDGAGYQAEIFNELEKDGVKYAIRAHMDSVVACEIKKIENQDECWETPFVSCEYELAELKHIMKNTKKSFRLVVKRKKREQMDLIEGKYIYSSIATNFTKEEKPANDVLNWYNQRGQAENYIKEVKSGFGMEQMPCSEFKANSVYFAIGLLAYNLFIGMKTLSFPQEFKKHTVARTRYVFINIAGKIIKRSRQIFLKICANKKILELFQFIRERIFNFHEKYAY